MVDTQKIFDYDKSIGKLVAGVDEVGRGPLAGPVVCAACIMPLDEMIDGIYDSKKVSEKKRKALSEQIKQKAVAYSIASVSAKEIDEMNILQATRLCMKKAVEGLSVLPEIVIVDALRLDVDVPQREIVKGDETSYNVAAASILAKVYRDELMVELAKTYAKYGFDKHKGYGTREHIQAIVTFGACPEHRKTFIKNFSVK